MCLEMVMLSRQAVSRVPCVGNDPNGSRRKAWLPAIAAREAWLTGACKAEMDTRTGWQRSRAVLAGCLIRNRCISRLSSQLLLVFNPAGWSRDLQRLIPAALRLSPSTIIARSVVAGEYHNALLKGM